jgi:polar amino acid transport system substrate-binding protein
MYRTFGAAAIAMLVATTAAFAQQASAAPPEVIQNLAPTGTLRAAINAGNVVLVQKDASGVHGVTVDLASALAQRLGTPLALKVYDAAGKVTDAVKTGEWDIAFVAIEPARAAVIGFTAPYVIIEGTYMVAADSPLKTIADVDRDGIRIAVAKGSAYDLYLTRTLQHATLVRYPSPPLGFEGLIADKLDAAAGVRQFLDAFAKTRPDMRVMPEHFQEIREAMGTPLGRDAGLQNLRRADEGERLRGEVAGARRPRRRRGRAVRGELTFMASPATLISNSPTRPSQFCMPTVRALIPIAPDQQRRLICDT